MVEHELDMYWKTVVDTIQDGIMIVDRTGTIVSINKAFEKITGYPKSEILGNLCTMLDCDACEIIGDRKSGKWCKLFRKGEVKMRRCVIRKSDGTHVNIMKNAALLYDGKGDVIGGVETLTDITELVEKDSQIEACRRELRSFDGFHGILGTSSAMQSIFDLIANAAHSSAPVIILGESGTGKELVAKAIHEAGPRSNQPFIKVNCAALNESLLESELFGHVKGAFTGAYQNRKGRFEAAEGGDIFIDEIGDLPMSIQVKLLRVLEEKVIERVGDNRPIKVDVRIITATNRDLKQMIKNGEFREDLYYRINVIPIRVPPLRQRKRDILLLVETFFRRIQLKSGKKVESISPAALRSLINYPWPGNVRELKSALEYAFVSCRDAVIRPQDLPPEIAEYHLVDKPSASPAKSGKDELKYQQLIEALEMTGGNQTRAADILGVSRVTVWNRMKKYGIRSVRKVKSLPDGGVYPGDGQ